MRGWFPDQPVVEGVVAAFAVLATAIILCRQAGSGFMGFAWRASVYLGVALLVWFAQLFPQSIDNPGVAIAVYIACIGIAEADARWYIIPDVLSAMLLVSGFWIAGPDGWPAPLVGCLIGAGLFAGIREAFHRLRGFHGLGFGDVKLAAALGSVLGPEGLPIAIVLAAGLTGLLHLVVVRHFPAKSMLVEGQAAAPLGFGLALSCMVLFYTGGLALPW